jgi:hypothetical protein
MCTWRVLTSSNVTLGHVATAEVQGTHCNTVYLEIVHFIS